jgi:hypothetical protein
MYSFAPVDCWDLYENEKFEEEIVHCDPYWSKLISLKFRIEKLKKARLLNKSYCNKSDSNLKKWCEQRNYF